MAPSTSSSAALTTAFVPLRRADTGERSERALVTAALAGDEAALAALYRSHWPAAYRVALLIVHDHAAAEDIAQETFVAAVRQLERFDRRRPFSPWLLRIATNRAIDWVRAATRQREVAAGEDPSAAASAVTPRRQVAAAGDAAAALDDPPGARGPSEQLMAALVQLPPEQRAVVVLRHLLDLTPGEIARTLQLPRGTVNSRLRRGLDALERALGERR